MPLSHLTPVSICLYQTPKFLEKAFAINQVDWGDARSTVSVQTLTFFLRHNRHARPLFRSLYGLSLVTIFTAKCARSCCVVCWWSLSFMMDSRSSSTEVTKAVYLDVCNVGESRDCSSLPTLYLLYLDDVSRRAHIIIQAARVV